MSMTYSLVCEETKKKVWIGQGGDSKHHDGEGMTTFYCGENETMKRLGHFLREHEGKTLKVGCDDRNDMFIAYDEFGKDKDPE